MDEEKRNKLIFRFDTESIKYSSKIGWMKKKEINLFFALILKIFFSSIFKPLKITGVVLTFYASVIWMYICNEFVYQETWFCLYVCNQVIYCYTGEDTTARWNKYKWFIQKKSVYFIFFSNLLYTQLYHFYFLPILFMQMQSY